jgi:hypothetical protein
MEVSTAYESEESEELLRLHAVSVHGAFLNVGGTVGTRVDEASPFEATEGGVEYEIVGS